MNRTISILLAIILPTLTLWITTSHAQTGDYADERELNRRIKAQELRAKLADQQASDEIIQRGDEELQRNDGRSYWPEDHVATLRRSTGRNVTQIWNQAKRGKNGRWIRGSGNISYSDAGFFCKFVAPNGVWFMAHQDCYDMDGTPIFSGRVSR